MQKLHTAKLTAYGVRVKHHLLNNKYIYKKPCK